MKAALALALVIVAVAGVVEASHFRYHTAYYTRSTTNPRQITMTVKQAWRRTSAFAPTGNIIGQTWTPMSVNWGDGSSSNLDLVVTGTDSVDDWVAGEVTLTHTFAGTATSIDVLFSTCCRIGSLLDGNNGNLQMTHVVKLGASAPTSSPQIDSLPMIPFALNQPNTVQLPLIPGSDGGPVKFAISPPMGSDPHQSGLSNAIPLNHGPFSFSSAGLISWTPNLAGLFAVQFNATSPSGVVSVLDVILFVRTGAVNHNPPVINSPVPTTINFVPGQVVTFNVRAVDPDVLDDVTIFAGSMPSGATLGACVEPEPQTTCTSPFSWQSTPTSGAQVICFYARDVANNVSQQYCVTLNPIVSTLPCANGNCAATKTAGTHCYANSAPVSVTGSGNCATLEFNPSTPTC